MAPLVILVYICMHFYATYVRMCLDPAAITSNARMASGQGAEALKNVITKGRLSDAHPPAADCVCARVHPSMLCC